MVLENKLGRNLRAAEESSDSEDYYEVTDRSSSASVIDADEGGNVLSSDGEEGAGSEDMVSITYSHHQAPLLTWTSQTPATTTTTAK
jgi:hypothetical protein